MPWGSAFPLLPAAASTVPGMMFRGFSPSAAQPASPSTLPLGMPLPPTQGSGAPATGTPAKPGFFSRGGGWQDVVGGMADALAGQPIYQTAQRDQRQRAFELEQARLQNAQREQDHNWQWQNWVQQQIWKQAHPDDNFTQYITAAGIDPRSAEGQNLYRQRAESMAAPPLVAIDGFDAAGNPTKTFMPRTGVNADPQPVPAAPSVGMIRNGYRFQGGDPKDRNSWVPVGGASSGGGASFP